MQMVHICSESLSDCMRRAVQRRSECPLVLALTDEGGVSSIACPAEIMPEVKQRLKIWSGCYGSWPLFPVEES